MAIFLCCLPERDFPDDELRDNACVPCQPPAPADRFTTEYLGCFRLFARNDTPLPCAALVGVPVTALAVVVMSSGKAIDVQRLLGQTWTEGTDDLFQFFE